MITWLPSTHTIDHVSRDLDCSLDKIDDLVRTQ